MVVGEVERLPLSGEVEPIPNAGVLEKAGFLGSSEEEELEIPPREAVMENGTAGLEPLPPDIGCDGELIWKAGIAGALEAA